VGSLATAPCDPAAVAFMSDDLDDLAAPNCVQCLHPMEVIGTLQRLHWKCGECGSVRLS